MDIKQLKASVQLAQMKFQINPSDDNKTLLKQAEQAYEKAKNPAVPAKPKGPKIDQISTDILKKIVTMEKPPVKAAPVIAPAAAPIQPDPNEGEDSEDDEQNDQDDQSGEDSNQEDPESEEKKTE